MAAMTDTQLWARVAAGDADAFGILFERHARSIYNYCFRRTADWAAAEDLTSSTFLEAWRRRSEVRLSGETALSWLYGVATNLARNRVRAERRGRSALERMPRARPDDAPDLAEGVAARIDDERWMREVLDRIAVLSDLDRDVFVLCVWQGLSSEQAAVAVGLAAGTVRSRLARARARLRAREAEDPGNHDDVRLASVRRSEEGRWSS